MFIVFDLFCEKKLMADSLVRFSFVYFLGFWTLIGTGQILFSVKFVLIKLCNFFILRENIDSFWFVF